MASHEWLQLGLKLIWTLFCFAYGACLGSLINVIVYRMPLGMSIVTPPSRCPSCSTRLTWRENFPIFGWLALGGKCRFCKSKISAEYPIVEAFTALLFAGFYVLYYWVQPDATVLGMAIGKVRPDFFLSDASLTWPVFVVILGLLASLVAATLVDAKTSTIPLPIVWVPMGLALVVYVGHAVYLGAYPGGLRAAPGYRYAIPHPGETSWNWIGAALGATAGLVVANVLLATRLITRSFADYEQWEKQALADAKQGDAAEGRPEDTWIQYPHARREMVKELAFLCPVVLLAVLGFELLPGIMGGQEAALWVRVLAGVLMGALIGGGVVWAVRILGSMAFGKEAMGLGDVHLMAAVGACLGWIDSLLAFFLAAFVGLGWQLIGMAFGGRVKQAMPYGPYLAVASVLVLLLKPAIELGLAALLHQRVNLP